MVNVVIHFYIYFKSFIIVLNIFYLFIDEQSEKSKEQSTEPLENNASKKAKSIMDQKAGIFLLMI